MRAIIDKSQGVNTHLQSTALEVVKRNKMELRLLAQGDGTEVVEQIMEPGARWALFPQDGWEALEYFQVLDGRLRWYRQDGDVILGPGSGLSVCPVVEEHIFEADTPVRLLYVSSRPVFHYYSTELQEMMRLAVAVETKDHYTADHCERITSLSMAVGRELNLPPARLVLLNFGAYLHDVGKVGVPESVLGKPGPLSEAEWEIMRRHTIYGREMVERTFMKDAGVIIEQHHERLDGSGYPYGLKGDEILLEAQIVAVVDSYDAMTTDRIYRQARSHDEAIAQLQEGIGTLYRRDVVETFIKVLSERRGG